MSKRKEDKNWRFKLTIIAITFVLDRDVITFHNCDNRFGHIGKLNQPGR